MTWLQIAALAIYLCVFGAAWSWLDREGERKEERWKMRALLLAIGLAVIVPSLGGFPHPHHKSHVNSLSSPSGLSGSGLGTGLGDP